MGDEFALGQLAAVLTSSANSSRVLLAVARIVTMAATRHALHPANDHQLIASPLLQALNHLTPSPIITIATAWRARLRCWPGDLAAVGRGCFLLATLYKRRYGGRGRAGGVVLPVGRNFTVQREATREPSNRRQVPKLRAPRCRG